MKSKLQVFVSSTYTDLKDDRQAAVEAILKAGHIPAGMELFAAGDKSQWEVIQQWILDSDVYLLILGGRYGTIDKESGLSYTELEYDFAVKSGKSHFAIVIKEDALEARTKEHGSHVFEKENPSKLKAFREKVLGKISSFFTDHKDIKLAVHESLSTIAADNKLKGWVRYDKMLGNSALSKQLDDLKKENKKLQDQLVLKVINPSGSKDAHGFQQLKDMMRTIEMADPSISGLPIAQDNDPVISLLMLVLYFKDWLINGVLEPEFSYSRDIDNFVFNRLCPRLERYKLLHREKGAGYPRRDEYTITERGWKFFQFLESDSLSYYEPKEPVDADTENDRHPDIIANLKELEK